MLKVRYDGFADVFTINGQTVARGGVFTIPNKERETVLRPHTAGGHRFMVLEDLPDDEQAAAVAQAESVTVPANILAQPVETFAPADIASEPDIDVQPTEPVASDKKRK